MFSSNTGSFPQNPESLQPASAPRGRIDQQQLPHFQPMPATGRNEQIMNTPLPFSTPEQSDDTDLGNSFTWDPANTDNSRQMQQPPRPPFNPLFIERRINRLEQQQERFQRDLQNLDRRVRLIERRLGFPIPPIGFPQR